MDNWDATAVKAQLRLTAQRLGQLQERKDSEGQVTRKDIATLLQQGNVGIARAKAQHLIHEDVVGNLLEALEMHVGLILEHFSDIKKSGSPSPVVAEAASSIIFAAPHTESKDLNIVRELLMQRLGPDFSRSAIGNHENHVSPRVAQALSAPPPSATNLNDYLSDIAKAYGVSWIPEPRRYDILNTLLEILDPTTSPVVDLPLLRKLCCQGLPDDPPWIRPRVWKLFLGVLPPLKLSWDTDIHKQRESYYDLVRRLLSPLSNLPSPTDPMVQSDLTLLNISTLLSRVPHSIFSGLQDEPEISPLSRLDATSSSDIRLVCASNLDFRLELIQQSQVSKTSMRENTPEIRLESNITPDISLTTIDTFAQQQSVTPTTLLSAKHYNISDAHPKHISALLRLLYIHSCLNPLNHSPHIPSLLIPLYSVFLQECEPKDIAHVEADTFWAFEAMIGEFSELEDEERGNVWMKTFSERLAWADEELSIDLHAKGLDPALPHYSYRWLAPLLTQTLPLSSVYLVWDALLACSMRERDMNPKIDHLLNICTSMLSRARAPLFRLGKPGRRSPGLWGEENSTRPPPSPLRPWELSDAFLEGMSILQLYPVEAAGGIDRILQAASDMAQRRDEEMKAAKTEKIGLGARLKVSMWKGFTNQLSSLNDEEEDGSEGDGAVLDDGNETETPQTLGPPGITTRLANTVWRGITNQTSMEVPPSPLTPLSSVPSLSNSPLVSLSPSPISSLDVTPEPSPSSASSGPGIWGYAEKLKDSDAAASFAKVSTNWRAKAMNVWSARKKHADTMELVSPTSTTSELPATSAAWAKWGSGPLSEPEDGRRDSLYRTNAYSPPPRPPHFRPPRDSLMPVPREAIVSSKSSPDTSPQSDSGLVHRTKTSLASLAGLSSAPLPVAKQGPRPLMLNSSRLISSPNPNYVSRSASSTPTPHQDEWEAMRRRGHMLHKDSQSSISSLSPSDALGRSAWVGTRSDVDSDSGSTSRVVPINRRSVSPMAPSFRKPRNRLPFAETLGTSSDRAVRPLMSQRASSESHSEKGWGRIDLADSSSISPPSVPQTPVTFSSPEDAEVHVSNGGHERLGSVILNDPDLSPSERPALSRKLVRKKTPTTQPRVEDTSDSYISPAPSTTTRIRSKRYPQRPSNLRIRGNSRSNTAGEKTPSPNTLAPEWPEDQEVVAPTPRATAFEPSSSSSTSSPRSPRPLKKLSTDAQESRFQKVSTEGSRIRKISTESKDVRRKRESAADEGDDEGYDDLLSAYESDASKSSAL